MKINLFDKDEISNLTDVSGNYSINDLSPNARYRVMQDLPFGWSSTFAGSINLSPEVVGGEPASIETFPFMAALGLKT